MSAYATSISAPTRCGTRASCAVRVARDPNPAVAKCGVARDETSLALTSRAVTSCRDPHHQEPLLLLAVCEALRACVGLELFFVHDVMMTAKGAVAVAALLRGCRSLGSLKLGSNTIGLPGLRAICEAVGASETLEELYLYDCNHTGVANSEGVRQFVAMIRANRSLMTVE